MKAKHLSLLLLSATVLFFTACGDEPLNISYATVTFDETSTKTLLYSDNFVVKGTITIPVDVDLSKINIYLLEDQAVRPKSIKAASTDDSSPEIRRIDDKNYEFEINQDNQIFQTALTAGLVGIKVDVILKTGYNTQKTWEITDTKLSTPPVTFRWEYANSQNPSAGAEEFGLIWEGISDSMAIIKKGTAEKFVFFETIESTGQSDWTTIAYRRQLKAAIDTKEDMTQYDKLKVILAPNERFATYTFGVKLNKVNEENEPYEEYVMFRFSTFQIHNDEDGNITSYNLIGEYKK